MKTNDLADHVLARLYDLAEQTGYGTLHSLDELSRQVGINDRRRIFDLAKSLEARGLIQAIYISDGPSASITAEGALAVEATRDQTDSSRTMVEEEPDNLEPKDLSDSWEGLVHSAIRSSALSQYRDGHWRDSVLNAFIAIFDLVRSRTRLDLDGNRLITRVFSAEHPILVVADLNTESGKSDQTGFMMVLQGVFRGIRNPKAHSLQHDLNALKAAQYLVMASVLARRIDEAEVRLDDTLPHDKIKPTSNTGC